MTEKSPTTPKRSLTPNLEGPPPTAEVDKLTVRLADTTAPVRVTATLPLGPDAEVAIEWRSAGATFDLDELRSRLAEAANTEGVAREELADVVLRSLRDAGQRASSVDYDTGRQVQLLVDHVTVTWPLEDGAYVVAAGLPR